VPATHLPRCLPATRQAPAKYLPRLWRRPVYVSCEGGVGNLRFAWLHRFRQMIRGAILRESVVLRAVSVHIMMATARPKGA
jgi:hypothetical protein